MLIVMLYLRRREGSWLSIGDVSTSFSGCILIIQNIINPDAMVGDSVDGGGYAPFFSNFHFLEMWMLGCELDL